MIALADLLEVLGNPSGDDDLLTDLEARTVVAVETDTDRYFGSEDTRVEYIRGSDTDELKLRERPAAVTTIRYRVQAGDDWTAITEADDDGWELRTPRDPTLGVRALRKNGIWASCYEFEVTYEFGYTSGAEPGDIRQAVIDLVSLRYHELGREGLRSETIGDYSYSVLATATGDRDWLTTVPGLKETLDRWRGHYA